MNTQEQNTSNNIALKILDEISKESSITQRTLSGKLNIALGLVNAYIKRLAKKGYIKVTKGPMNRVKYFLTPKGLSHRVSLTYNFMQSSILYYKDIREKVDNIFIQMTAAGKRDILIWGDGEIAEISYISMRGLPLNLVGVVDSKQKKEAFFGFHIYSFEDVANLEYDAVLVASFSKETIKKIEKLGIDEKLVYLL